MLNKNNDLIDPPLSLLNPRTMKQFILFIIVWFSSQGYRFETIPFIVALVLLSGYCYLLFRLRQHVLNKSCGSEGENENSFMHSFFGVSEAWLNAYPLACAILVFLWDYCIQNNVIDERGLAILPPDTARSFITLFIFVYTVTNQISRFSHSQFYHWFRNSGIHIATRRGWGARGYDLFGVFPQEWIPRLSTSEFQWLFLVQTWNFYMGWSGKVFPPALHFLFAFFIVLLRHSMLFAENNAGMHKPVLLPAVCWYMAFAPQLWSTNGDYGSVGPLWPTSFLKIHIISTYFTSGLGKVIVTWKQGKWNWADGTNMQYYLFAAGFARPGRNGSALPRIGWFIQRRWVCIMLGIGGLTFELGSPLALLGGNWCILMFFVAIQFHYGVFFLQGIDFTGQWVPCLLVFLVDRNPVSLFPKSGMDASTLELLCWVCGALLLLCQLFCAFTLREVTATDGNKGGIPFSCLHMFTLNSNIFGDDFISWFTLMSGDQRSSGHLGIMEWSGPIFTDFHMSEEDMAKLPFKVVWFGHTMNKHNFLEYMIKPEFQNKRLVVFSNFEMSNELKKILQQVCRLIKPSSDANSIYDKQKVDELVALQRKLVQTFNVDTDDSARRTILTRGESFLLDELDDRQI